MALGATIIDATIAARGTRLNLMLLCIHVPYYRIELIGHIVSDQQTLTRRLVAEAPKQLGLLARRRSRPASVSHFMYTRMGEGARILWTIRISLVYVIA